MTIKLSEKPQSIILVSRHLKRVNPDFSPRHRKKFSTGKITFKSIINIKKIVDTSFSFDSKKTKHLYQFILFFKLSFIFGIKVKLNTIFCLLFWYKNKDHSLESQSVSQSRQMSENDLIKMKWYLRGEKRE